MAGAVAIGGENTRSAVAAEYRPDIDGLRALAVVPVILFHAGLSWFPGGFVGVDVFFVISGYLITSILWRDISAGNYSLVKFYERRVRRIAPALLVMLAATTVAVWFSFLPRDLAEYSRSLIATLAFASNIYFYQSIDYFSSAADLKPLLHTWSLAVEEQFYIVFPVALYLLSRFRQPVLIAILVLAAAASLAGSIMTTASNPDAAFYLPFSRMWELLCGSLLALTPATRRQWLSRDAIGWLGIALIAAAVFMFSDATPFPGAAALLPCLGAVAVIAAGRGSSARALGAFPVRFVGKISYSLYLWHWPILALYRYHYGKALSPTALAGILAATFALSYLSWRYIEGPWRRRADWWTRGRIFGCAGAAAAAFALLAVALPSIDGIYDRFPPNVSRLIQGATDINPLRDRCDRPSVARIQAGEMCKLGAKDVSPTFALLGDSIGDALMPGIQRAAEANHTAGVALTYSGCPPLFGVLSNTAACPPFLAAAQEYLRASPDIKTIILVARWATIIEGRRFGETTTEGWFLRDQQTTEPSYDENLRVFDRAMGRLAASFPDRKIWIVGFVPEQAVNVPRTLGMEALHGDPFEKGLPRAQHEARNIHTHQLLNKAAQQYGFRIVDLTARACDADFCPPLEPDGAPRYADDNHPSHTAALHWSDQFIEATHLLPASAPVQRSEPVSPQKSTAMPLVTQSR